MVDIRSIKNPDFITKVSEERWKELEPLGQWERIKKVKKKARKK